MKLHRIGWIVFALTMMVTVAVTAAEEKPKVTVERWLVLGPIAAPLPAFNNEDEKAKVGAGELLAYPHVDHKLLRPVAGETVPMVWGKDVEWKAADAPDTTGVSIGTDGSEAEVAYLAAYVEVPRWMTLDVEARSHHAMEVFVDGESIASQKKPNKKEAGKASGTAKVKAGKHLLLVKTVDVPSDSAGAWSVAVTLSPGKDFDVTPVVSIDPTRTMTIEDVLDGPSVGGIQVSPDGRLVALTLSEREPPEGTADRWVEVRDARHGSLVQTLRDISGSNWQWAPVGNRLSYVNTNDGKGTLRVIDLDTRNIETIVEDVKDFSGYQWGPDGTFVVYSVNKEPEKDKTGVKRMIGVSDRREGERNKSSLYLASVPAGVTRQLTAGEYSVRVLDVHPSGKTVLITRTHEDLSAGPYEIDELAVLNIADASVDPLWSGRWFNGGIWSPDGKKILVVGGPSTFGDVGVNVAEGESPNEYDRQAFLFDPATKTAEAITKDFDPTVESVFWPKRGGDIYMVSEAGEYNRLYRYSVKKRTFKEIELPTDVVHGRDVARDEPFAVLAGSSANRPPRLFAVDLAKSSVRDLYDPMKESYAHVTIGDVEDFDFTTSGGTTIVGRVHFPPDFDPGKKWPAIVYYYGGTSPVTRSFGGRYPKNLWAAHGYVVYVLQPSGATGFGQEFSAVHVNDWGKTTAGEIIEGTKKFLAAHPYVDPKRVGCIGASFGGFMTELLVTQTDIFAAAVSHAGISDISSYWGEGYWGYQYNAVSAMNSFPWNRPDIYINQSPLFHADKVVTPLLLLHGGADTNVPRGESDQMYAALKILGKEVEYIRVEGQNHWILDYKKRIVWNDAILSWFDRWLKDQPQWWNDMYPPLDDGGSKE